MEDEEWSYWVTALLPGEGRGWVGGGREDQPFVPPRETQEVSPHLILIELGCNNMVDESKSLQDVFTIHRRTDGSDT